MKIPLSRPDITDHEKKRVMTVLNSGELSCGKTVEEFERKFAKYIGTKYAVAVNSGTSGLHLCLGTLDLPEFGQDILTTPFSFVASANCVLHAGYNVEFIDINEKTLNIDWEVADWKWSGLLPNAVLPVHVFGVPCEIPDEIYVPVIEDACEALGADVGTRGDCAVFAFYPNKQITTGEGGMIVTDNEDIHRTVKSMRNQGREGDEFVRLGYNYRMSDVNAALGVAQLERIEEILAKRRQVAAWYTERLQGLDWLIVPQDRKSWFVYVVRALKDRDKLMLKLWRNGIDCRAYFDPPIHLTPFYRKEFGYKEGDFPVTEKVSKQVIALPFYNNLTEKEVDYVCEVLQED